MPNNDEQPVLPTCCEQRAHATCSQRHLEREPLTVLTVAVAKVVEPLRVAALVLSDGASTTQIEGLKVSVRAETRRGVFHAHGLLFAFENGGVRDGDRARPAVRRARSVDPRGADAGTVRARAVWRSGIFAAFSTGVLVRSVGPVRAALAPVRRRRAPIAGRVVNSVDDDGFRQVLQAGYRSHVAEQVLLVIIVVECFLVLRERRVLFRVGAVEFEVEVCVKVRVVVFGVVDLGVIWRRSVRGRGRRGVGRVEEVQREAQVVFGRAAVAEKIV